MSDDGRQQPTAGATALADDEAAMKKGKGRMIAGMTAAVVVALAALAWFTLGGEEKRLYSDLGKKINGLESKHFDGFWGCAFRGFDLAKLENNEVLQAQIELRSQQGGRRYAQHVRDDCLPKLAELQPELDGLMPPEPIQPSVQRMADAVGELRSAWSNYIGYLDQKELEYDSAEAKPYITKIARGWYEFRKAHAELNEILREKLGKE